MGWIETYTTGAFNYFIDQTSGGATTMVPQPALYLVDPLTGSLTLVNGTNVGDPVNVSNGNLFQQQTDQAFSSRGPDLSSAARITA